MATWSTSLRRSGAGQLRDRYDAQTAPIYYAHESMHLRRRAGPRSFPWWPHPGSTYPESDPKQLFLAVHSPSEYV